jgi:hypothetical protein
MIKYKKFNKDGELMTKSSMDSGDWTDAERYEYLPRALKKLRDSQGEEPRSSSKEVKGVIWSDKRKKWEVRANVGGRQWLVGRYNTYEVAICEKVLAIRSRRNA